MTGGHPLELNRAVPVGRLEMVALPDGTEIPFQTITAHVARFRQEIASPTDTDTDLDDHTTHD